MGQQVGFYAIGKDHTELLRFAENIDLLVIPELIRTDTEVEPVRPTQFQVPNGKAFFYLLPSAFDITEVFYGELPDNPTRSKLISYASPVIQFKPCHHDSDGRVFDGRMYLNTDPSDPRYSVVHEKYKDLARSIRRWAKTDQFGFYVGPYTAELAQDGHIRLMHHRVELKVV